VIVTPAHCHQPTRDYIARRRSEVKSTREAIRCLKRYLARQVWRLLQTAPTEITPNLLT
jgi:transposase